MSGEHRDAGTDNDSKWPPYLRELGGWGHTVSIMCNTTYEETTCIIARYNTSSKHPLVFSRISLNIMLVCMLLDGHKLEIRFLSRCSL